MKPYKPSNYIDKTGGQWLLLTAGIGGITLGGGTFLVSQLIYLVVIFPVLLGLGSGWLLRQAVVRGKVRHPLAAGAVGVCMAGLMYGTMHWADYALFRQNANAEIRRSLREARQSPANTAKITVDDFLKEMTGKTGFRGFLQYRSQQGLMINRSLMRFPVGSQVMWNYWGLEFLVTGAIALGFAYAAARKPFCEGCQSWYTTDDRLGRLRQAQLPEFLQLLSSKEDNFLNLDQANLEAITPESLLQDFNNVDGLGMTNLDITNPDGEKVIPDRAGAMLASRLINPLTKVYPPSLEIHLQHCANCDRTDGLLQIYRSSIDKNGLVKFHRFQQGIISTEQVLGLYQGLQESLGFQSSMDLGVSGHSHLWQRVTIAHQERSQCKKKDIYIPHNLTPEQLETLRQQLSTLPTFSQIKQAYLVQKAVDNLPEHPFYLLGIIRHKGFLESATAQVEWESILGNALSLPGDFGVVLLNENRKLQHSLQNIEDANFYKAPVKKNIIKLFQKTCIY
ncbi:MAG: hypothetical protein HC916_16205 [Coleofasciculaceae cyanobacterium SM2_1_6]|nr:hypothetical protein [Coleofasciculaceae cyanobacterium SM2_1_6]